MRDAVVVVAVLAFGCGNKASAPEPEAKGSAATGPNEDCGPAEQQRRWDLVIEGTELYLTSLEGIRDSWTDCEAATKALTANAAEATRYADRMKGLMMWLQARGKTCAEAFQARFGEDARIAELEARGDRLEADIKPRAEACKDAPGFQEAFAAGVKLMKKK
jgi:hypothetical protein